MLDVQLERLADLVEATPEPVAPLTPAAYRPTLRARIEVRNLAFRYAPDQPPVFADVSFAVAPGEYVARCGQVEDVARSPVFRAAARRR